MPNKRFILILLTGVIASSTNAWAQNDFLTLFTTNQERQIIDANRYKNDPQSTLKSQMQPAPEKENTAVREEVNLSILLSGFTRTQSGQDVAWVNGKPYDNRAQLEDGSTIIINKKKALKVQIKTPDGKYHNLSAGKAVNISYLKPLTEG